ncbi:MAG: nuclear transport factor 2 family protein [Candidatus Eremiobacteraeota bacterium]|nr:nuclear transport factor 2 family protein [Candidatus Eremiobacteraeota bacterium]
MFSKTAIALGCACALLTGLAHAADAPAATTAALTAIYNANCTLIVDPTDANLDKMFTQLSPEYVSVDPKGKETKRDEVIGSMKQELKTFHGSDCKNTFDTFTSPDANTAVVVGTQHVTGDMQAPDGKHDVDFTAKSEDTWKLIGGNWTNTRSKALHVVIKIDGAVVQDQGP